ncbi:hypothetical protein CPB85DRAFT_1318201 [Mucidula mucida]|nr:hypothetical protein CPB85DRAFT_1318201 [Mucidula mucida]
MQKVFQRLFLLVAFSVLTEASSLLPRPIDLPKDPSCLYECYAQLVEDSIIASIGGPCIRGLSDWTPACACHVAQTVLQVDKGAVCGEKCPVEDIQAIQDFFCALPTGS